MTRTTHTDCQRCDKLAHLAESTGALRLYTAWTVTDGDHTGYWEAGDK